MDGSGDSRTGGLRERQESTTGRDMTRSDVWVATE